MKAVVIGATGHTGTYLVPRLVDYGFEVTAVTRGQSEPYTYTGQWREVERVKPRPRRGGKGRDVRQKDRRHEPGRCRGPHQLQRREHEIHRPGPSRHQPLALFVCLLHLGARRRGRHPRGRGHAPPSHRRLWPRQGGERRVPARRVRQKRLPYTAVMPGHITGPGWNCINPTGNFDPEIFERSDAANESISRILVWSACITSTRTTSRRSFFRAIQRRTAALDQDFPCGRPAGHDPARLCRGHVRLVREGTRHRIPSLGSVAKTAASQAFINSTYSHLMHSDNYSCERRAVSWDTPRAIPSCRPCANASPRCWHAASSI